MVYTMIRIIWQRYVWAIVLLTGLLGIVIPTQAVYEGIPAEPGEYPWFVQLGSGCGGVMIDAEWVLTARHCVSFSSIGSTIYVKGDDETPQEATIGRVIRYDASRTDIANDIALVQLTQPIENAAVVTLPEKNDLWYAQQSYLLAVGQGRIDTTYQLKDEANLPDITDQEADHYTNWYEMHHTSADSIIHYNNRLTLQTDKLDYYQTTFLAGRGQADSIELDSPGGTCYGDSGGGLIYNKWVKGQKQPTLLGIVSSRDYCTEMALRKLFEADGDSNKLRHTLPNGVTIDIPEWYLDDIANGTMGYSSYTNVSHYSFTSFIYCNVPGLRPSGDNGQTTITGQIVIEDEMTAEEAFRQYGLTSVVLNDDDGDPLCMTAVDANGNFSIALPGSRPLGEVSLSVQSVSHRMITYTDGSTGIHPVRGASNKNSNLSFYLYRGHDYELQSISIRSEPLHGSYQLLFQPTDVTQPLLDHNIVFMPMLFTP